MEKKEYFSQLLKLYEAVNAEEVQAKIADSGSDVNKDAEEMTAQPVDNEQPEENTDAQESSDNELDDAAYLNPVNGTASNDASTGSDNKLKLVKLFDLFENLLTYSEMYSETLETIDTCLLDDSSELIKYKAALLEISTKIRDYLENTFKNEVYEKTLYVYVMLRTELLTAIQMLRKILKLNEVEEKI